jgi:hypothetical protein
MENLTYWWSSSLTFKHCARCNCKVFDMQVNFVQKPYSNDHYV